MSAVSGVYAIVNTVTGKRYIGSSAGMRRRWVGHRNQLRRGAHHSVKLQAAYDKYGEAAFMFVVLCECEIDDLVSLEQAAIEATDAVRGGYNVLPVAGSTRGHKISEETRKRMSAYQSRRTPEHRARLGEAHRGRTFSAEHREKLSAAKLGGVASAETRARMTAGQKQRHLQRRAEQQAA